MKIEANKFYRTRDGRKAYVAAIAPEYVEYGALGWIEISQKVVTWNADGFVHKEFRGGDDIIAEWVEPAKLLEVKERWVYVNVCPHIDGYELSARRTHAIGRIKLEPME